MFTAPNCWLGALLIQVANSTRSLLPACLPTNSIPRLVIIIGLSKIVFRLLFCVTSTHLKLFLASKIDFDRIFGTKSIPKSNLQARP